MSHRDGPVGISNLASGKSLEVPILLLVFNRLDCALKVLQAIRRARPKRLYVAGDAGRNAEESRRVEMVREQLLDAVDCDCRVMTLFHEENLGCRRAVRAGIDWFFKHEEAGIILEDDCLPHPAFFRFCTSFLTTYKDDTGIGTIMGSRFRCYGKTGPGPGQFSNAFHCWGWASWRRTWQSFGGAEVDSRAVMQRCQTSHETRLWSRILEEDATGQSNTWD